MLIRPTVRHTASPLADLSVVVVLAAILYGVVHVARHWDAPLQPHVEISLSPWALPGYVLRSLIRGVVAYGLSLTFTLCYGYLAAHRPRAERIMLPLLDICQSIPVLGFLPAAMLALVALFPRSNIGLELTSILMIFTGQVWNMAFSFYNSLRSIPAPLQEAASVYQFNWWQRFRRLELPASVVGLAWNSMMSMAGGWFFLIICEAFTLGGRDFRLPGLGAYMSEALARQNLPAVLAGIVAMVLMIMLVDACVWRPVIVWAQKFRIEETAAQEAPGSFVLTALRRSWLVQAALARVAHPISEWLLSSTTKLAAPPPKAPASTTPRAARLRGLTMGLLAAGAAGVAGWAAWRLLRLLAQLPMGAWGQVAAAVALTLCRVMAAVVLGTLWTVPVGIWIGQSDRWCSRLQPLVQVAASFPAPMLYPLILAVLSCAGWGIGAGAVILMLLGTQWYVLFNVIAGASAVPADLREAAAAYQFTPRQRWRTIWWPAVFPYLVTGWVTASGGAWNASIVAEYVSVGDRLLTARGLGSLISTAAGTGQYALLAAGVLTMSVTVIGINRYVWKRLYHIAQTRYAY